MENLKLSNYRIKISPPKVVDPGTSKVMFGKKEILLESLNKNEVMKTEIYIDENNSQEFAEAFARMVLTT